LVIAAAAAYIFAEAIVPSPQLPAEIEIAITATGKKNAESKGTEIWILNAPQLDLSKPHPGWEPRENQSLVSYLNQPDRITWTSKTLSTKYIELYKHPFSGIAEISVGTVTKSIDLYSAVAGTLALQVADLANEAFGAWSALPFAVFFVCLVALGLAHRFLPRRELARVLSSQLGGVKRRQSAEANKILSPAFSASGQSFLPSLQIKSSLLVFFSSVIAAHFLLENRLEIGSLGVALTFGWFLFVLWLELFLVGYMLKRVSLDLWRTRIFGVGIEDGLLLAAFMINLYCTFLFSVSSIYWLFFYLLVGSSLLFLAAIFSSGFEPARRISQTFCATIALTLVFKALTLMPTYQIEDIFRKDQTSVAGHPRPSVEIESRARPNIYFLSLDAIGSRSSMRQLFKIDHLELWTILERNGFLLRDARSPGSHTLETFYNIFTLHPAAKNANFDFLLGFDDNPIVERLKRANYRVQSIQGTAYFGLLNGYWDFFHPTRHAPFGFCWSLDRWAFFFGVCRLPLPPFLQYDTEKRQFGRLQARVVETQNSGRPWFTFSHVLSPGHTEDDFLYSDEVGRIEFIKTYLSRLDRIYEPLESLLTTIRTLDPNGIVILHSDHGPWLTKGWSKESDRAGLYDERIVEMDQTSVLLAVYPKEFCTDRLNRIVTTAEVLPAVFQCLDF
jgi:hypothetical protein